MRPSIATAIRDRLAGLIRESQELTLRDDDDFDAYRGQSSSRRAWFVAVENLLGQIVDDKSPYRRAILEIAERYESNPQAAFVQDGAAVLLHLQKEIDAGLIGTLAAKVQAETFDDLRDLAEAFLEDQRKDPAGVIAGVFF